MCVNEFADRCSDCMDCADESGKTPAQKLLEASVLAEKAAKLPKCHIGERGMCPRLVEGDYWGIQGCSLCSNQRGLSDSEKEALHKAYWKEVRRIKDIELHEDDDVLAYTNDGQNDLPDGNFR